MRRRSGFGWLELATGLLLIVVIELLQPVFGRSFDANDIILNFAGVLLSTSLFFLVHRCIAAKKG